MESLIGLAVLSAFKVTSLAYISRNVNKNTRQGKVTKILIYPVKSCLGISVDVAEISKGTVLYNGIHDRNYAIVWKSNGEFLSLKYHPELARIQPQFDDQRPGKIILTSKGTSSLFVESTEQELNFSVGQFHLVGYDCGDKAATWVSNVTGKENVRLVYMPNNECRDMNGTLQDFASNGLMKVSLDRLGDAVNTQICLSSKSPTLVMSEEGFADLNQRMMERCGKDVQPIDYRPFRPNIIVQGISNDDEEDRWDTLYMDDAILLDSFPCKRCIMTTVDIDKACIRPDGEPMKTLSTYRKNDKWKGNLFGHYCYVLGQGTVRAGCSVTVSLKKM